MARGVDIGAVYRILKGHVSTYRMPVIDLIEKQTKDPFKILVSTILSARTQDRATREASQRLFKRISTPDGLENLSVKEIEKLIYPVGFYKQKARYLKQLPEALRKAGGIPQCIDELVKLPGVGRKTANLVVSVAFRKPGICVDTHVHRIMNRLGYVRTKTPFETEMALRRRLPRRYWTGINSMLVAFGQNLCRPVYPRCSICPVYQHCNRVGVNKSQRR
jgi:endonuclease III